MEIDTSKDPPKSTMFDGDKYKDFNLETFKVELETAVLIIGTFLAILVVVAQCCR